MPRFKSFQNVLFPHFISFQKVILQNIVFFHVINITSIVISHTQIDPNCTIFILLSSVHER